MALIEKWKEVCQDSIRDLKSRMEKTSSSVTIPTIMSAFHIEPELLEYNEEEEDFL